MVVLGAHRHGANRGRGRAQRCAVSEVAFAHAGLDYREFVKMDPRYLRPAEVDALCGDASKARERLGWEPTVTFRELVQIMVDADVKELDDQLSGRAVRLRR